MWLREDVGMAQKKRKFFKQAYSFLTDNDLSEYLWYVIRNGEYQINAADTLSLSEASNLNKEETTTEKGRVLPSLWWFILVIIVLSLFCMYLAQSTMWPMVRRLT
jgi:hypothetical protein